MYNGLVHVLCTRAAILLIINPLKVPYGSTQAPQHTLWRFCVLPVPYDGAFCVLICFVS